MIHTYKYVNYIYVNDIHMKYTDNQASKVLRERWPAAGFVQAKSCCLLSITPQLCWQHGCKCPVLCFSQGLAKNRCVHLLNQNCSFFLKRSLLFETAQGSRLDVALTSSWGYVVWEGLEEKWGEWSDLTAVSGMIWPMYLIQIQPDVEGRPSPKDCICSTGQRRQGMTRWHCKSARQSWLFIPAPREMGQS